MDAEMLKVVQGVADSLTSLGLCLGFIWYLIKKLDRAENWLYKQAGDNSDNSNEAGSQ